MNRTVIFLSCLLYALDEQTKAEHLISQKDTNIFTTLQLNEDVSTLAADTKKDLGNDSKLEADTNVIVSERTIEIERIGAYDTNGFIHNNARMNSEEKTEDQAKRLVLENAKEDWRKETYTDPSIYPMNSSEDPINPNVHPKTSIKDRTNTNSNELLSSNLSPLHSSEDIEITKDSEMSIKDPLNSKLGSRQKRKISNEDSKYIESLKPDYSLIPPANRMFSNGPAFRNQDPRATRCLTGYMTDIQEWVDANGNLTHNVDVVQKIDLSSTPNPLEVLSQMIHTVAKSRPQDVAYLSLAKCNLKAVPRIFNFKNARGRSLQSMVEYMTFFGNDFASTSNAGIYFDETLNATGAAVVNGPSFRWSGTTAAWAAGFTAATLSKLKELDLRRCSINELTDNIFANMPNLQALYLGENYIQSITADAFAGLQNLRHLDMSRNLLGVGNEIMIFQDERVFKSLENLVSLDFSFTRIQQRDVAIFKQLGSSLQSLSICYAGLNSLLGRVFANTQLRYLDLSGNVGVLGAINAIADLQKTLEVIYAKEVGLKSMDAFEDFEKLQIIDVDNNEIVTITRPVSRSLKSLKALILDKNRFVTWWEDDMFSFMPRLQLLSLRHNNINFISNAMIEDLKHVDYIGLSGNFIVCNCYAKELFEIAYRNQNRKLLLQVPNSNIFLQGYEDVNRLIKNRKRIQRACYDDEEFCMVDEVIESEGNFTLFDYDPNLYSCLSVPEAVSIPYSNASTCIDSQRAGEYYDDLIGYSETSLMVLFIIPVLIFPALAFLYVFRRNLRYFWITMKNSATLSLINSEKNFDEDAIFHYDVFVSYCNGDRDWVLDHLLPHVERDCNVSVCLHERDFQVGLSILENIVSCMDRSRCIMLIISRQFLESQWCQFEMHLAQHRLLETRREDLILVLLEEIPRRMRPTTLHYLMLTKTYILWPQKEAEQASFWKRLARSLIARSRLVRENVSLA